MASQIVVALFGAVFLGAVLVLLGLRGKRLNRHPICGLCGFDLEGTYPQSITCPECGAGLRRRKGVRIGARRKRWIVLCAGALLILLPAGVLGTALYAVLTGADLNSYKPVGLLLWEGRRANDATAAAAVKELLTRVQNKQVGTRTVANLVDAALEIQADPDATWRAEWGDIIETAKLAGTVDDENYQRFLQQGAVLAFAIRPRVRQGDPVAVEATVKEARVGSGSQIYVQAQFTTRTIDGQSAQAPASKGGLIATFLGLSAPAAGDQPSFFQLMGTGTPWGGRNYGQCLGVLYQPEGLAPGPHTAKVSLVLRAQVPSANGGAQWLPLQGLAPSAKRTRTATIQFVVTPPDEPTVRLVEPTPEQIAAFRQMLTPQTVQLQTSQGGLMGMGTIKWVQINFNAPDLPLDGAFTARLRGVNSSTLMLPQNSEVLFRAPDPGMVAPAAGIFGPFGQQWVTLEAPDSFDEETVTIVLEPNLKAALRTVDITEIYGQTIELKDVPVNKVQW